MIEGDTARGTRARDTSDVSVVVPRMAADHRLRVLLVEDDDGDAFLVQEMLTETDTPVTLHRVETMADALRGPVDADCVLLDLQLPDAVGLAGLTRLRRHAPRAAVVVLTGQRDEGTGMAAVASGAQDYLVKDQVDGTLLTKALRYAWERKRAEETGQELLQQQLLASENSRLERGLLPTPLVTDSALHLETRYRPGRNGSLLGGDFYDAVELPDGTVQAMIGDVCGHGPDEAALGVALRIAWRSLVLAGLPMSDVLPLVQRVLVHERIRPIFATLCAVQVASDRRSLRFCLAGHPPPLLISGGDGALLPSSHLGVPLGVVDKTSWRELEVELRPGWSLLLYTDGVYEGRVGDGGERLGHEKMATVVLDIIRREPAWRERAGRVLDQLITTVEQFNRGPLDDDLAIAMLTHVAVDGS
jgi:serine phosphatase RsbU (regulator of sigma subunit)